MNSSMILSCVFVTLSVLFITSSDAVMCEGKNPKNMSVRNGDNVVLTDVKNIGEDVLDSDLVIRVVSGTSPWKIGICNIHSNKTNECPCMKEDLKNHTFIDPKACKIQVSELYQSANTGSEKYVNATIHLGKANKNMLGSYCLEFEVMQNDTSLQKFYTLYKISYEGNPDSPSSASTTPTTTSGAGRSTVYNGSLLTCWAFLALYRGLLPF